MFSWFVVFPRFLTIFAFVEMSTVFFFDFVDFLWTAMWTVFCSHTLIYYYSSIYVCCQVKMVEIIGIEPMAWNVSICSHTRIQRSPKFGGEWENRTLQTVTLQKLPAYPRAFPKFCAILHFNVCHRAFTLYVLACKSLALYRFCLGKFWYYRLDSNQYTLRYKLSRLTHRRTVA